IQLTDRSIENGMEAAARMWMFHMLKSLYDTAGRTVDGVPGSVSAQRGNPVIAESAFSRDAAAGPKRWPTNRDDHACATHREYRSRARTPHAFLRRREGALRHQL